MSAFFNIFRDAALKRNNYPAWDVLAAVETSFARGETADAIALLQKNPAALDVPQDNGATLFENAFRQGKGYMLDIARAFPQAMDSKNPTTGSTLLMRLAADGERNLFLALAGMGAGLHARDNMSNTLMHYAAMAPGADIMLEAAKLGCGKNAINNFGQTPLMFLPRSDKKPGVAAVYLSSGFRLNAVDNKGLNATMHAIDNLRLPLAVELMDAGGEVDFTQAHIMTEARAVAQKTPGGTDFLRALTRRHAAQERDAEADKNAAKAAKEAAEIKKVEDVVDSLRIGTKGPLPVRVIRTVRFKTPSKL